MTADVAYPVSTIVAAVAVTLVLATLGGSVAARAGFPLPDEQRRLGCIDGLRGYLALSVLAHHFIIWLQVSRLHQEWVPPSVYLFNELGKGAVGLFFMITGCLFYPRIARGILRLSLPTYLLSRVFRIVPMVALVVVVIAVRTGRSFDADLPGAVAIWVSTYAEPDLLGYRMSKFVNAAVLWSLWYEWAFYLVVLPACAVAVDALRGRVGTWVIPILLAAGAVLGQKAGMKSGLLSLLPSFAVGMLAYECQQRESIARRLRTPAASLAALLALGAGMLLFEEPFARGLPLFGFFFTCVACGNDFGGVLRLRGALVLGECSFAIDLLHGIALSIMFEDMPGASRALSTTALPMLMPLVALIVVPIACVLHLVLERPSIQLGHSIRRRWAGGRRVAVS